MSLVTVRDDGRVYRRRFDHEEAARRHAAGETLAALVVEYGVTKQAVSMALRRLDPAAKAADNEYKKAWRTTTCESCGGPAMRLIAAKAKHNHDGRTVCMHCRPILRRERLLFDAAGALIAVRCSMLDCANGERWQPPDHFCAGESFRDVRPNGIHDRCRACSTRAHRRYRARHRAKENAYTREYKRRRRKEQAA